MIAYRLYVSVNEDVPHLLSEDESRWRIYETYLEWKKVFDANPDAPNLYFTIVVEKPIELSEIETGV